MSKTRVGVADEFARAVDERGGPVRPALLPLLAVVRRLELLQEDAPIALQAGRARLPRLG